MSSIVILYTELASYNVPCFNLLVEKGFNLHVVRYPINKEAPFDDFNFNKEIVFYNRNELNEEQLYQLIDSINPDLVLCSGWADKLYLKAIKHLKNKNIPKVLSLDNQWKGNVKQLLGCLYSRVFLTNLFNHCFVPGDSQALFAKNLGFKKNNIIKGFYTADTEYFNNIYQSTISSKEIHFPHRFIFVGRYYEFKGINDLWQAFEEFKKETNNDWELWCLGTGSITPKEHPQIKHYGFVQPRDITPYMANTGVFVLPSLFEPWAVVVHEFAAAGYPIIASDKVGAATTFVKNGTNGNIFKSGNIFELKELLKSYAAKTDEELIKMGKESHKIAQQISPQIWADNLTKLIK